MAPFRLHPKSMRTHFIDWIEPTLALSSSFGVTLDNNVTDKHSTALVSPVVPSVLIQHSLNCSDVSF